MTTLIARWTSTQDPAVDRPQAVFLDDGRPATHQDYLDHLDDTHELFEGPDGNLERRMYPSIVANVRYDGYMRLWFVVAPGQEPISLDLPDVTATDDQITAALYEFPLVYRVRIWR
jgi:hypothetical protein